MAFSYRHNIFSYFVLILIFLISFFSPHHLGHADEAANSLSNRKLMGGFPKPPAVMAPTSTTDDDDVDVDDEGCPELSPELPPGDYLPSISVDDFGAKGDGYTDDTEAFAMAWGQACSSEEGPTLIVPSEKSYLVKPIKFTGPCKSGLSIQIYGSIVAPEDRSLFQEDMGHWIVFDNVENLEVGGGGVIDGHGKIWWENSCKRNKSNPCIHAPTALSFRDNKQLVVKNLTVQNAQQMHLTFEGCENVVASNLVVSAPEDSPNTDGIHVTGTQNILISTSTIGTGDDCISIVSGSQKVQVEDIVCGPGHGISIGSLGKGNSEAHVSDISVNRAKLSGTTNGLRIKTWQGGSGSASRVIYQNVEMENVRNPIIIDQNYCDQDQPCPKQGSAVQVSNVVYQDVYGVSASDVAIKFDCSESYPCLGILLENVQLRPQQGEDNVTATCNNVHPTFSGPVYPNCDCYNSTSYQLGS